MQAVAKVTAFFLLFIRAQWVLPHSLLIFCLCARLKVHPGLLCPCACACAIVGVCTLCSAWKGKRMRANWVSQEAGLESDLISLMCDQCEWEAGTRKASVAMQLSLLQTCQRPETDRIDTTGGFRSAATRGWLDWQSWRGSPLIPKIRLNTHIL